MSPEQLSIALANIKVIEGWIKAVHTHAYNLLRDGGKIPGYRLGYGLRRRVWKPGVQGAVLELLRKEGVKEDELMTIPELISPAQTEKILKLHGLFPKRPRGQKEKPSTMIDPFIELSMPEQKVIPATGGDEIEHKQSEAYEEFSA